MTTMEYLNTIKSDASWVSETAQSFYDQSLYLSEAMQIAYNDTFKAIGLEELATVMEADELSVAGQFDTPEKKKSVLKKIGDFFAKIWAAIKAFFNKILSSIKMFIRKNKDKGYDKLIDEAEKFFGNYKGEEIVFGKVISLDAKAESKRIAEALKSDQKVIDDVFEEIKKFDWTKDSVATLRNKLGITVYKDETMEVLRKAGILDKDQSIRDSIRSRMTKDVREFSTKQGFHEVCSTIKAVAFKDEAWTGYIKDQYNEMKKNIDKQLKQAKELTNITTSIIKEFTALCNTCETINSQVVGGFNDGIKAFVGSYTKAAKSMIVKYLGLSPKNKGEVEKIGESTEENNGDSVKNAEGEIVSDKDVSDDLVDEAFAWLN